MRLSGVLQPERASAFDPRCDEQEYVSRSCHLVRGRVEQLRQSQRSGAGSWRSDESSSQQLCIEFLSNVFRAGSAYCQGAARSSSGVGGFGAEQLLGLGTFEWEMTKH